MARDLIKPTTEDIEQIKNFFHEKYSIFLTDTEAKEVYSSLYYLGSALNRYLQRPKVEFNWIYDPTLGTK